MNNLEKIDYKDFVKISKKISNPFSREIYISKVKEDFASGYSIFYDLGNGIAVFLRDFVAKKDFILSEESNIAGSSLFFNLSSNIKIIYKDKKEFFLKKNHFFIELASSEFYCEIAIKKNQHFKVFFIGIKEELFLKLSHKIKDMETFIKKAKEKGCFAINDFQIDALQYELFNKFEDKEHFEDTLKSIFLESVTMNLIHYTIEKVSKNLNQNLQKDKVLYLEKARNIILNQYNQNLSIKDLAYKCAVNECYLKKDFKEYFGMTILEMIQDRRLEVAKELLKECFSIKEVAFKVGYKHSGNFSKLFFEKYKLSPSSYQKQIKSIY